MAAIRAEGEWTQAGAPAVLARSKDYVEAEQLDMSGIARIDSAGLALMLELTRRAQAKGKSLRFVAVPQQLVTLASFFELDSILSLQQST